MKSNRTSYRCDNNIIAVINCLSAHITSLQVEFYDHALTDDDIRELSAGLAPAGVEASVADCDFDSTSCGWVRFARFAGCDITVGSGVPRQNSTS